MLTGVFKERSKGRGSQERAATEEQAFAELLAARELRNFTLARHCEIGPFVVDYLFPQHSLIVELAPDTPVEGSPAARRHAARVKFFNDMGYVVFTIESRDLRRRPGRIMGRLLTALRS